MKLKTGIPLPRNNKKDRAANGRWAKEKWTEGQPPERRRARKKRHRGPCRDADSNKQLAQRAAVSGERVMTMRARTENRAF